MPLIYLQEEITLSKYSKALSYQRNGEIDLSLHTFREIIEDDLPKLADKDGLPKKFVNLKYSCHRNVGMLFYKKNLKGVALDYYLDVCLKFYTLCLKAFLNLLS